MSDKFLTVFNRKPAKNGDHYHFTIPKKMIEKGIVDPEEYYEIRVYKFDVSIWPEVSGHFVTQLEFRYIARPV